MIRLILTLLLFAANSSFGAIKEDSCISSPTHIMAVLVDISDPFDEPGALAYQSITDRLIKSIPNNGRLDIYKISQGEMTLSKPSLQVCKPAPETENSLFSGKKFWEKKQKKMFFDPAREYFSSIQNSFETSNTSPILESIYNISLRSFSNIPSGIKGDLVIISDFMQNSKVITFYGKSVNYQKWRDTVDGRTWVRKFDSVSVEAIVIPRKGANTLTISGRDFFYEYLSNNFNCMSWRDLASSINVEKKKNGCI